MNYLTMLALAGLVLAACGSGPTAEPEVVGIAAGVSDIQIVVASNDFEVGRPRVPFVLFAGQQDGAPAQRVVLRAFDLSGGTPMPNDWIGEARLYEDYDVPYWVVYPELPRAGYWGLVAKITLPNGGETQSQFTVEAVERTSSPAIGAAPPASHNRTLAIEPDIHKLSSDIDPNPGLYQMTIAEALETGRPTVVTFATPAFCTSRLCGPVVDSVEATYAMLGERANFIHVEVYKTFDPLEYADEMFEWGLATEPWTFVLDSEGTVAARLGGPLGVSELTQILTPLLP